MPDRPLTTLETVQYPGPNAALGGAAKGEKVPNSEMERLREIRDTQRCAREMNGERDRLIRLAAKVNSERAIAMATGLSPGRVHQIVRSG